MAVDTWGTKGEPQFLDTGAPAIAVDPTAVGSYAALVGNRIAGTAAQRTANVFPNSSGKPITDGIEWYETDTGDSYLRDQGAWLFKDARSGLTFPSAQTNWSIVTGSTMYRVGRELHFHWNLTKNAAAANADLIMVLPTGQRPLNDTEIVPGGSSTGGAESLAAVYVSPTDGGVRVLGTPAAGARSFRFTGYYVVA